MLQKQLRELTWWLSIHQFRIKSVHLSGELNRLPDLLSRWHEGKSTQEEFYARAGQNMQHRVVPDRMFNFTHNW